MVASDEDWSDWDVTVNNGLDGVDVSDNLLRYFQKLTNLQFSVADPKSTFDKVTL